MKTFKPFDLERWQSKWETTVRHNLAESGVAPLTVGETLQLTGTDPAELAGVRLAYSQTIGTEALRAAIAGLYPRATPANVLVTVGSSEANFVSTWSLVGPGDVIAVQVPAYEQIHGLAANLGATVRRFGLDPSAGWSLNRDEFREATAAGCTVIALTNPNNPTGHVLTGEERAAVVECASRPGTWLLVDEVYRGAEIAGEETRTLWGATPRTVVTGGLSKAFGLPGLRLGWVVGPADFIAAAAARHDYAVIGPAGISDFLATRVLAHRPAFLDRTRRILCENYGIMEQWRAGLGPILEWTAPAAGAILLARYHLDRGSEDLAEYLRANHDVLVVPGAHVGLEHNLRLGFGEPPPVLRPALDALGAGLRDLVRD